ncbi:cytochrome b [Oceanisphaera litoralis]|uniref:cytochrome b/b6 domain-containing protein n=1 Tax=Oceanisphaera litoralis TaxID=225144 RepID=UPI0019563AA5|nr:cytochrome b/b6 domain-containing protein [Oceanisphaera litoralis]MBM7456957.1 cytochrome b [Oceanisphaera litoralis]
MSTSSHRPVHVWDWSIRIFHWSLPILLFLLWRSAGDDMEQHMLFAQWLLGLLLYRIIWGFIGTPYARFSHFIYHPARIIAYLRATLTPHKPVYLSHNPLGGVMVLVMLGTLLFQAGTGLFATDDIFYEGPLYSYVSGTTTSLMTDWHKSWFYQGLLLIIGLHILAIVLHRLRGEGLVKAMVTGHKEAPLERTVDRLEQNTPAFPWLRFGLSVALAAGIIWTLFNVL